MMPILWSADLSGAWFGQMERNGASEVPFLHSSEAFPKLQSMSPHKTLQPTSAVQGVSRVCSALGRTCLGPAVGDAESWKGVCLRSLVGWASPSPHTLPVVEANRQRDKSREAK